MKPSAGHPARPHVCERCGSEMVEHHCKIRCPNCGYVRDCSDPRRPDPPIASAGGSLRP